MASLGSELPATTTKRRKKEKKKKKKKRKKKAPGACIERYKVQGTR